MQNILFRWYPMLMQWLCSLHTSSHLISFDNAVPQHLYYLFYLEINWRLGAMHLVNKLQEKDSRSGNGPLNPQVLPHCSELESSPCLSCDRFIKTVLLTSLRTPAPELQAVVFPNHSYWSKVDYHKCELRNCKMGNPLWHVCSPGKCLFPHVLHW